MNSLSSKMKSLAESLQSVEDHRLQEIQYAIDNGKLYAERSKKAIQAIRPVIANLEAAGFQVSTDYKNRGDYAHVDLGFFPSTKKASRDLADKLRSVRLALGVRLGQPAKELKDDGKKGFVEFTIRPDEFAFSWCFDVWVKYHRRLPRSAKCKIVTHVERSRRLVCEAV